MVVAQRTNFQATVQAYAFVDGGYLRAIGKSGGRENCDPQHLAYVVAHRSGPYNGARCGLSRTIYFDAEPENGELTQEQTDYWNAIETLDDTHLGFGWLRGKSSKRGPRQKAVDTLLAVEMLSGAFNHRFDVAILIASDADFVPVVNEVRRAGPHVVVAAVRDVQSLACSDDLVRACDRFVELPSTSNVDRSNDWYRPIKQKP